MLCPTSNGDQQVVLRSCKWSEQGFHRILVKELGFGRPQTLQANGSTTQTVKFPSAQNGCEFSYGDSSSHSFPKICAWNFSFPAMQPSPPLKLNQPYCFLPWHKVYYFTMSQLQEVTKRKLNWGFFSASWLFPVTLAHFQWHLNTLVRN